MPECLLIYRPWLTNLPLLQLASLRFQSLTSRSSSQQYPTVKWIQCCICKCHWQLLPLYRTESLHEHVPVFLNPLGAF